ncbi:MAG: restriction endonuclease subunit S [Bacteroidales bacterium]|nr:restriction endonuclease subunit S [Bacteroidales bacterium]
MINDNQHIPTGYKPSPLGPIPEDWEVKRLGEICTHFKSGITITSKDIHDDGLYPVYGGNGLRGFANTYTHDGNYILIGRQGALCGNINYIEGKNYISEHAIAVQTKENMQWLKYKLVNWNLNRFSESSAQPGLSVEKLVRYKLFIPTRFEQNKIAEILSLWDTAIAKQTALIEKLTLLKRGLMQQLLTGKKRLKGFGGEWKNIKLGSVADRITRKNEEDNQNVVTISAQRGFVVQTDFFNKSVASETLDNYFLVHKDEFCYNKSYSNGYPMGAIKRLKTFDKAVVTTLYICFALKSETTTSIDFFEQYCESGILNKELVKVANEGGRAHGLLNVTPFDFFNMHMNIPGINEQNAIASVLVDADKEIEIQKQKLAAMQEQKRGLMQVLLSGKRRVE